MNSIDQDPNGQNHNWFQKVKKVTYNSVRFVWVVLREAFPYVFCAISFYKLASLFVEIGTAYATTGSVETPSLAFGEYAWLAIFVCYSVKHFLHDLHEAWACFKRLIKLVHDGYVVLPSTLRKLWANVDKFGKAFLTACKNLLRFWE